MVGVVDEHGESGAERSSYSSSYKTKTTKRSKGYRDKCPGSTQNKSRTKKVKGNFENI
ncbi:hypothetical protein LINPERHAP2_LOCUS3345, partial [Linum perenne]